jgi:hypothetical protein
VNKERDHRGIVDAVSEAEASFAARAGFRWGQKKKRCPRWTGLAAEANASAIERESARATSAREMHRNSTQRGLESGGVDAIGPHHRLHERIGQQIVNRLMRMCRHGR